MVRQMSLSRARQAALTALLAFGMLGMSAGTARASIDHVEVGIVDLGEGACCGLVFVEDHLRNILPAKVCCSWLLGVVLVNDPSAEIEVLLRRLSEISTFDRSAVRAANSKRPWPDEIVPFDFCRMGNAVGWMKTQLSRAPSHSSCARTPINNANFDALWRQSQSLALRNSKSDINFWTMAGYKLVTGQSQLSISENSGSEPHEAEHSRGNEQGERVSRELSGIPRQQAFIIGLFIWLFGFAIIWIGGNDVFYGRAWRGASLGLSGIFIVTVNASSLLGYGPFARWYWQ